MHGQTGDGRVADRENIGTREQPVTLVHITAVDLDDQQIGLHLGYYVDEDHDLRAVELEYAEAVAVLDALTSGCEWVGLELEVDRG
jgi:hypothetical protein